MGEHMEEHDDRERCSVFHLHEDGRMVPPNLPFYYVKINASKILDGLFLGNKESSQDIEFLSSIKCKCIINCAGAATPNLFGRFGIRYLTYRWADCKSTNIFDAKGKVLKQIFGFIDGALARGFGVLVHSVHGNSRACIAVVVYLMMKFEWPAKKAYEFVRFRRPEVKPKSYFLRQLKKVSKDLGLTDGRKMTVEERWLNQCTSESELLIRNTFLNGHYINVDEPPRDKGSVPRRGITWVDQTPGSTSSAIGVAGGANSVVGMTTRSVHQVFGEDGKENTDLSVRFSASNKVRSRPRSILKAHCRRPVVPYRPPQPRRRESHQEQLMSRSSSIASAAAEATAAKPTPATKQSRTDAMVNVKACPYSNATSRASNHPANSHLSNNKNLSISSEAGTSRQRRTRQRPASAKRKKKVTSAAGGSTTKEVRHLRSLPQRLSKRLLHADGGGVGATAASCTSSTSSLVSFDIDGEIVESPHAHPGEASASATIKPRMISGLNSRHRQAPRKAWGSSSSVAAAHQSSASAAVGTTTHHRRLRRSSGGNTGSDSSLLSDSSPASDGLHVVGINSKSISTTNGCTDASTTPLMRPPSPHSSVAHHHVQRPGSAHADARLPPGLANVVASSKASHLRRAWEPSRLANPNLSRKHGPVRSSRAVRRTSSSSSSSASKSSASRSAFGSHSRKAVKAALSSSHTTAGGSGSSIAHTSGSNGSAVKVLTRSASPYSTDVLRMRSHSTTTRGTRSVRRSSAHPPKRASKLKKASSRHSSLSAAATDSAAAPNMKFVRARAPSPDLFSSSVLDLARALPRT